MQCNIVKFVVYINKTFLGQTSSLSSFSAHRNHKVSRKQSDTVVDGSVGPSARLEGHKSEDSTKWRHKTEPTHSWEFCQ